MQFWYGVIRNKFGKIRAKRVPETEAPTQEAFLVLMEYKPDTGDVVVELDFGNHMGHSEFMSYVSVYFQSSIRIKRFDVE